MSRNSQMEVIDLNDVGLMMSDAGRDALAFVERLYGPVQGFVLNSECYRAFLVRANLGLRIEKTLEKLRPLDPESLSFWSEHVRRIILSARIPETLQSQLEGKVRGFSARQRRPVEFAIHTIVGGETSCHRPKRGSGVDGLAHAVLDAYASLFEEDVIEHRKRFGFSDLEVTLVVTVRSKAGLELARLARAKQ